MADKVCVDRDDDEIGDSPSRREKPDTYAVGNPEAHAEDVGTTGVVRCHKRVTPPTSTRTRMMIRTIQSRDMCFLS